MAPTPTELILDLTVCTRCWLKLAGRVSGVVLHAGGVYTAPRERHRRAYRAPEPFMVAPAAVGSLCAMAQKVTLRRWLRWIANGQSFEPRTPRKRAPEHSYSDFGFILSLVTGRNTTGRRKAEPKSEGDGPPKGA